MSVLSSHHKGLGAQTLIIRFRDKFLSFLVTPTLKASILYSFTAFGAVDEKPKAS